MRENNQPTNKDRLSVSLLMCHNTGAGGTDKTCTRRGSYMSCAVCPSTSAKRMTQFLIRRSRAMGDVDITLLQRIL